MASGSAAGRPGDRDEDARPPGWLKAAPLVFVFLWSGGYTFAKLGIVYAEPMTFLALRYAVVLVLLAPLALILRPPMPRSAAALGHLCVVGLLLQGLYFGLSYVAFYAGISAGASALILAMQPILVGLLAPLLGRERVGPLQWLGLALGLAGASVVIVARTQLAATVPGIVATVGALTAITAATLYEKRFGTPHHPVTANLVQYAVGFVVVGAAAVGMEELRIEWTTELLVSVAYLVIGNSLISVTLLLTMLRWGEASKVSALLFLVPPTAGTLAWIILGEAMPPIAWLGMALAAVGVAIATRARR